MKKLVASDMDGTLIPYGKQRVPITFFDVIEQLNNMDVMFTAASGRQLPSLKLLFEPLADDIIFIAENGAYVVYKDEIIHEQTLSPILAKEIIKDIIKTPGCDPIVSTRETVYISKECNDFFRRKEDDILYTTTITDDFLHFDEGILKVTACNFDGIRDSASRFYKDWNKFAEVTVSGAMYCDFMHEAVSKGNALKKVLQRFNLTADECIAFGDNYNDISMLDVAGNSFVMTHADDAVREHAKYETSSVEDTVRKIYNI